MAQEKKIIYCCKCKKDVHPVCVTGLHIYPHRPDLNHKYFWLCVCGNYVGCHKDSKCPLGSIPFPSLRDARQLVHAALDPLWKSGPYSRNQLYKKLSRILGWKYHTASIRSVKQANKILKIIENL